MASSISSAPLIAAARTRSTTLSPYSIIASSQSRPFSVSQRCAAGKGQGQGRSLPVKQPSSPSMKSRGKDMTRADMPQDIGLLPGTYIKPLWRDMPSIFKMPKERLLFEWLWLKTWFANSLGLVVYCKSESRGLPLRLKERRQVARDFYEQMYSAFAAGNTNTIRRICCTGLANSLIGRIEDRPRSEKITWSLDKYIRAPSTLFRGIRVVSDRAMALPELPQSGVRQVVLRITSSQSTSKLKGDGSAQGPAKQQKSTEYLVLQKLRWTGVEEPWRVWGYASPTTVDDLSTPMFAPGLSVAERLEAMQAHMGMKK